MRFPISHLIKEDCTHTDCTVNTSIFIKTKINLIVLTDDNIPETTKLISRCDYPIVWQVFQ